MTSTTACMPGMHVSDTAYLGALCRAMESDRPDARFQDRYAARLAAPKTKWLTENVPALESGRWLLAIRTCLLDEQILQLVADGADTVVNLAAGLDTRPYRLALPSTLNWIEADFPEIIAYKKEALASDEPRCRLERVALDLGNDEERRALISRLGRRGKRIVVLTEGLLPYFAVGEVDSLAAELRAEENVRAWVMDVTSSNFVCWMRDQWKMVSTSGDVQLRFAPPEGAAYFNRFRWDVAHFEPFHIACDRFDCHPVVSASDGTAAVALGDSGVARLVP